MALEVTGRIQVGRFVFEIGHPGGTRAHVAREAVGANPAPLALALDQPDPPDVLTHAEEAVEEARVSRGESSAHSSSSPRSRRARSTGRSC